MNRKSKVQPLVVGLTSVAVAAIVLGACSGSPSSTAKPPRTTVPSQASLLKSLEFLGNPKFYNSAFDVVAGSTASMHWSGGSTPKLGSGMHLVVTSSIPGFSSDQAVGWPAHTSPKPTWNGTGWVTTANAISVAVPADAAPGTRYQVAIETCIETACEQPATTMSLTVAGPSTTWDVKSYRSDFSKVASFPAIEHSSPFAITYMPTDGSFWAASEFSHHLMAIRPATKKAKTLPVETPAGAPKIFKTPFADCNASTCVPGGISALSEDVTTSGGLVWATFGGFRVYANGQRDEGNCILVHCAGTDHPSPEQNGIDTRTGQPVATKRTNFPPNHSEVVAYDPATKRFCTYLVPGDNTQVAGVAVTGQGPDAHVWYVASYGSNGRGSLGEFDPSAVGSGCDGRTDRAYVLPASTQRLTWPSGGAEWPVQIAADPSSPTLWITNFNPFGVKGTDFSGIDKVDVSDPAHPTFVQRFTYPSANPSNAFGAKPWHILAPSNSNYVYAIDNGDARIVRIDKTTDQMQFVSIPLTTDLEDGFGLSISSGRLYFALADDFTLRFGAASTFGYLDLSSWPADGPPASGVVYTGLDRVTDPKTTIANYRAIAVSPSGEVGLTNSSAVVRLTPRS